MKITEKFGDVHAVAAVLGVSERLVQNLALEGMPRQRHGVYDLTACVAFYEARSRKWRRYGAATRRRRRATAGRDLLRGVRRQLKALPGCVAASLVGKNEAEIQRLLRGAIREALTGAMPQGD